MILERNEHEHIVFTVTGLELTGAEELERLQSGEYTVSDYAKQMLTSTKPDGYDSKHRLPDGKKYEIVLLPSKHIIRDLSHTTSTLCKEADRFGYNKPRAGIVPRIRESVSDAQMEEIGFMYIAVLHDPIIDICGVPRVLASNGIIGRCLGNYCAHPYDRWDSVGAFAFFLRENF